MLFLARYQIGGMETSHRIQHQCEIGDGPGHRTLDEDGVEGIGQWLARYKARRGP